MHVHNVRVFYLLFVLALLVVILTLQDTKTKSTYLSS